MPEPALTTAEFGAFAFNIVDEPEAAYVLDTLSGVAKEAGPTS